MKRIIPIALIALFFAPALITVSWLKWHKHLVKKQVKWKMIEGLEDDELVHLVFDASSLLNLRWEHDREFEYLGEMYDVVRSREANGEFHFWCWHDHDESSLNRSLEASVKLAWGKSPRREKQGDRLSLFLKSLWFALPGGCDPPYMEKLRPLYGNVSAAEMLQFGPDGPPPRA